MKSTKTHAYIGVGTIVILAIFNRYLSIIGINFFLFLDNLLEISKAISPWIMWAFWGLFVGLIYGSVVAWKKFTLDFKLNFIPIGLFILVTLSFLLINMPLKSGTWAGIQISSKIATDTTVMVEEGPAKRNVSKKKSDNTTNSSTISEAKSYSGNIGNLQTSYTINWMSDGTLEGTYSYTSRPDMLFTLKGKGEGDKITLEEYTNGTVTGRGILYSDGLCFTGKIKDSYGYYLEMKICESAPSYDETAEAENEVNQTSEDAQIYTFVEQPAEFSGGDEELITYIKSNIVYPTMEKENSIQGKVMVRFVVMEDGSISDAVVTRGISEGLDKEALRIVNTLPKFSPGRQQGKPVRVYFSLPIVFKL